MGRILDDKTFLNDNIFLFGERINSPLSIFLDKTPTFTTYYHIATDISTVDNGFLSVDQMLGDNSPIRFKKIYDFPIYGIESILPDLNDDEEGLTVSFETEGVILPNTVKPMPNDYFTISYLDKHYTFMVDSISYDTIKSNNFYRINFELKSTSTLTKKRLEKQTVETFKCIFGNIGTKEECIILYEDSLKYDTLVSMYEEICLQYKTLFYSEKFNSLLYYNDEYFIYDKYLTYFITSNKLFYDMRNYTTLYLYNEDTSNTFFIEYLNSLYNCIEKCNKDDLKHIRVMRKTLVNNESVFYQYSVDNVKTLMFIDIGTDEYVPDKLIDDIKNNNIVVKTEESTDTDETEGESTTEDVVIETDIISEMIIKYFNNSLNSLNDIDLSKLNNLKIDNTYTNFMMIPIILFILKKIIVKFISTKQ
jgi:hypothetical protein